MHARPKSVLGLFQKAIRKKSILGGSEVHHDVDQKGVVKAVTPDGEEISVNSVSSGNNKRSYCQGMSQTRKTDSCISFSIGLHKGPE